jgi:hypothetical protein
MLISYLSICAMLLGISGSVPQIVKMLRSQAANGQSPLGWTMALCANLILAYINLIANHSTLLFASNLAIALLCLCAIALILWLSPRGANTGSKVDLHSHLLHMPTQEFNAVKNDLHWLESQRRSKRGESLTGDYSLA